MKGNARRLVAALSRRHGSRRWPLLHAMGIPHPSSISLYETLQNLLTGWSVHYGFFHNHSPQHHVILPEYPGVYKLTPLPAILDTIFSAESPSLRCQRCQTNPVDAGICLICGTTVCMQSHCCREIGSQIVLHAYRSYRCHSMKLPYQHGVLKALYPQTHQPVPRLASSPMS